MQEAFIFLLALTVIIYIAYPIIVKSSSPKGKRKKQKNISKNGNLSQLQSQKAQIYDAIKDLEMDYQTGKISQADYEEMKASYKAEAIEILKGIDAQKGTRPEVKTKEKTSPKTVSSEQTKPLFCSECGTKNQRGSKFCMNCGYEIAKLH